MRIILCFKIEKIRSNFTLRLEINQFHLKHFSDKEMQQFSSVICL